MHFFSEEGEGELTLTLSVHAVECREQSSLGGRDRQPRHFQAEQLFAK